MTAHALARLLLAGPDVQAGYFDGEGYWLAASGLKQVAVDDADWQPIGIEKQTGDLRPVIEIEGV